MGESAQPPPQVGDLADLTAVVLAGGLGTRLRASVSDRPKVLAEVLGRPFLAFLLDQLVDAGLRRIVLCTGYMGELVEQAFGERYRDAELVYSREEAPLGTGGALRLALPKLGSDPALVLNGDSYCDVDLVALRRWQVEKNAHSALTLTEVPDTSRYGRVDLDAEQALTRFQEKGDVRGSGFINAGVYLLSERVLESIPAEGPVSLEREVLPNWIGEGLYGFPTQGRFLDIGTPQSYTAAARFFADGG